MLKSTGSAFEGFIRDQHTTLVEVNDRIFSTSIDLTYTFAPFPVSQSTSVDVPKLVSAEDGAAGSAWDGDAVAVRARAATLELFAEDESASVQVRNKTTGVAWDYEMRIVVRPRCTRWVNAYCRRIRS